MADEPQLYKYVRIPADDSLALDARRADAGWAGDQLPDILRAAFAGGSVSERAVREHAHRQLGEEAGGLDLGAFRAAVSDGSVETFALVHPSAETAHEGVYAYVDECGLLKGLPRNERACSLARACGLDGVAFHGDVFVGRVRTRPEPLRNASFGLADMASDAPWLRRAPADNAAYHRELAQVNEAVERSRRRGRDGGIGADPGAGAEAGGADAPCLDDRERTFWLAQQVGEAEVRVPLPDGLCARDLAVHLAPGSLRCEAKAGQLLLLVRELHAPIKAEDSTWEVRNADESDAAAGARPGTRVLVLTLVKVDGGAHWPRLSARARPKAS